MARVVNVGETETLEIRSNLLELSRVLRIADENGLFCKRDPKKEPIFEYGDIFQTIHEGIEIVSRHGVDIKGRENARKKYEIAFHEIYSTIDNTRWSWRFSYVYGGPFFAYFAIISLIILGTWYLYSPVLFDSTFLWIPFWAFAWGTVGGIFQGVWSLWHQLESQSLRRHLVTWYFLLPWMGAVLGAVAYLVF